MKEVAQEIFDRIDNDLYQAAGDIWRRPDSPFFLMQSSFNPARVGYFKRKLFNELNIDPQGKAALEVGCGGGILCEEIARLGFDVTGIDPAAHSLRIAADHARAVGLRIAYERGRGRPSRTRTIPSTSSSAAMSWSMCATWRRSSPRYPAS